MIPGMGSTRKPRKYPNAPRSKEEEARFALGMLSPDLPEPEPCVGGRPRKLQPDKATLQIVFGLGRIQATTRECAAVLGVAENTFLTFKREYPDVEQAYKDGAETGKVSLRRAQFKLAESNVGMAIWLGKQYLNQRDVQYQPQHVPPDMMADDEICDELEELLAERRAHKPERARPPVDGRAKAEK